jgi:hypothetical protein
MTYVASYFHAFSSQGAHLFRGAQGGAGNLIIRIHADQAETVSRRIDKFADLMRSIWVSRNDYERRVRAVRDWPHVSRHSAEM